MIKLIVSVRTEKGFLQIFGLGEDNCMYMWNYQKGDWMSLSRLGKPLLKNKGKNHYRWKGGKDSENHKIRQSLEYKLWRRSVFERDNFKCIWCGVGGKLNADHIKPFALYPELRFAIDNGRTLCVDCHKTTDTFGGRTR
jgi:hypothetical protein